MTIDSYKSVSLPDVPGVYRFLGLDNQILYIGKATSLRDRVRSYFSDDLLYMRGKHIVDMVTLASKITYQTTETALEALVLESSQIKKHQPYYNSKEKDDKSFNYLVITNEDFPKVLLIRERTMYAGTQVEMGKYKYSYGPFPSGKHLAEAMKIIRKIFSYRDTCIPKGEAGNKEGKPCFNFQLGLCPGVCVGEISKTDYAKHIKHIRLFFEGKKKLVIKELEQTMHRYAKNEQFEQAHECKKMLFGLLHLKDVSLLDEEVRAESRRTAMIRSKPYRIESYDIAHISGKYTVGVMVVLENGIPKKSGYRKFKIRVENEKSDDTLHLEEVLMRRFRHNEWETPDLIVIDGGTPQKRRAEKVLRSLNLFIDVVSVVKDNKHKAKAILGNREIADSYKKAILISNLEAHRFAITYHRTLRDRLP